MFDCEKVVVGFVVKNYRNEFLIQYSINNKMLDVGLLDSEVSVIGFNKEKIAELFSFHTGHDISEAGEIYTLENVKDNDCIYKIFYLRANWSDVKSPNYIWLTYQDIEAWHNEGRINNDQMSLIKKANRINFDTLTKRKLNKTKIVEPKLPSSRHISIIQRRINAGRCIKPTDKEQEKVAREIILSDKHESIKNFPDILNHEELLLEFAKISPNPLECNDYFYGFINEYLLKKSDFRRKFLRNIYLNDNVYTLIDIEKIIKMYELQKENDQLLFDIDLKKELISRLSQAQTFPKFDVKKYESDKHYRREKDKLVELNKLKEAGLKELVKKFDEVQKPLEKEDDEW